MKNFYRTHNFIYFYASKLLNSTLALYNMRHKLMSTLQKVNDKDLEKEAIHPRLGTPMRLIDLAYFVAKHDDHHLAQITFLASL